MRFFPPSPPFDFNLTLRRYQAYGEDSANHFDDGIFRKVFTVDQRLYLLILSTVEDRIGFDVQPTPASPRVWVQAETIARKILGLDFPVAAFYAWAERDPVLTSLTRQFCGLRPTLCPDLFEMLVTSITAQQINLRFAFAVRSRLIRQFGEQLHIAGKTYFAFPSPENLAAQDPTDLRALQFTAKKSEYIIDLARAICNGKLKLSDIATQSNEEIAARLLPIRGIGRWTIDWLLARGLGRGDAIAAGDLVVRKAIRFFYLPEQDCTELEARLIAEKWGQFTNLTVHYLLTGMTMSA